jgi:ribosomal protein S18 acetylase RimI-like enzyme
VTRAPDDRALALHAEVLAALPGDPYVIHDLDATPLEAVATEPGVAAAVLTRHLYRGVRWVTALAADPDDPSHVAAAVRLAESLARSVPGDGEPLEGLTLPYGGQALLPDDLRPTDRWAWDAWFLGTTPEVPPTAYGEVGVVDLAGDDPRLELLLAVASPDAPYRPGDPRIVRWAAVVDPEGDLAQDGGLAAVLAVTRQRSGAWHLNDVATHPDRRAKGLARARVSRDAFDAGAPAVTLGMYTGNEPAARVYSALGFVRVRSSESGPVPR